MSPCLAEAVVPCMVKNTRPKAFGNSNGIVRRTRVYDDNFVNGIFNAVQAGGKEGFLVLYNHAGGDGWFFCVFQDTHPIQPGQPTATAVCSAGVPPALEKQQARRLRYR